MANIPTQLLTGKDNKTHDIGRWMGAVAFIVGICLEVYAVVFAKEFNFLAYGGGIAAIAGGIGALIALKANTEPDGPKADQP